MADKAYIKRWQKANPDKVALYQKRWRKKKGKRWLKAYNRRHAQKYRKTRPQSYYNAQRKCHFRDTYGITIEEYNALLKHQKRKCAICGKRHYEKKGKRLHVDHCHKSKKVRGLLCSSCNNLLRCAKDDIKIMKKAEKYLYAIHRVRPYKTREF
jgi:hypothetical protein